MQYSIDVHTHTVASGHAYSTLQENIRHAAEIGMKMVGVSDHGVAMPGGPGYIHFQALRMVPRIMYGVEVLRGVEANIMDFEGHLDMEDQWLRKLDFVIASYHDVCVIPSTPEDHTRGLLAVMENEYVDIIGHSGNPMYEMDIVQFVKAAKEKNKLIEINNNSFCKARKGSRANCLKIALEAKKLGVGLILGSDAHISFDVGNLSLAHELVVEVGIPEALIMNTSPERLKQYLFQKGKALDIRRE